MKKIGENATCSRRSAFAVVDPHSISTSPAATFCRRFAGGDRGEADPNVHAVELVGYVLHDLAAKIDRIADRLPQAIEIRERQRALAIAERDGAGLLDTLERAGQSPNVRRFLRIDRQAKGQHGRGGQGNGGTDCHARGAPARAAPPLGTHQATCG